jgi:hypothetical protein
MRGVVGAGTPKFQIFTALNLQFKQAPGIRSVSAGTACYICARNSNGPMALITRGHQPKQPLSGELMKTKTMSSATGLLALALVVSTLLIVPGCSDDDNPTDVTDTSDPFEFSVQRIGVDDLPTGLLAASDARAADAVDLVEYVNGRLNMANPFMRPAEAVVITDVTDTLAFVYAQYDEEDTLEVAINIERAGDEIVWTRLYDGTDHISGCQYDSVLTAHAVKMEDESWGHFVKRQACNDPDPYELEHGWSVSPAEELTVEITFFDHVDGWFRKATVTLSPDGDGTVMYIEEFGDTWRPVVAYTWDDLGNGTWTDYTDGMESDSGSWTSDDASGD